MAENRVTTFEELKEIGDVITIHISGKAINVKVRKPDIMCMITDGKIPNPLLKATMSMTKDGRIDLLKNNSDGDSETDYDKVAKWIEYLRIIAKETLVSPSYNEFISAEITLTSQNLMDIYAYATSEVNKLESFRNK